MSRIGRLNAAYDIMGLYFDPYTNGLFAGFYSYPPAGQMWTASGSAALPTSVGDIDFFGITTNEGVVSNKVRIK